MEKNCIWIVIRLKGVYLHIGIIYSWRASQLKKENE